MNGSNFSITDLSNCEREPIHTPGSIQPHGFLFVLDPANWQILGASTNAREFFWREATGLIGTPIGEVLGENVTSALTSLRPQPDFAAHARYVATIDVESGGESQRFLLVAHAASGGVILEGEHAGEVGPLHAEQEMQRFLARLGAVESIPELHRLAVTEVRRITGFDRCLLYQFDADWNGTVIAEDRNGVLPTYMNQRFPASDIPRQARELYRRNQLRLIPTNTYKPVPIALRAGARAGGDLDLSLSVLRSVSPIHLEYMRNMGTGSSMSISVMRGGELWGLISCHSRDPRFVPFVTRSACELLGQFLSLLLAAREQAQEFAYRMELTGVLTRLVGELAREGDVAGAVSTDDLLRLAAASGAALVSGKEVVLHGRTPSKAEVLRIADKLAQDEQPLVFWDHLTTQFSEVAIDPTVASGLLAVTLPGATPTVVLWFRPEMIEVVEWSGEPRKAIEAAGAGFAIHPRKSFEIWRETVRGHARRWEPAVVAAAREFRETLLKLGLRRRA